MPASDDGTSLIEVLITLMILGIGVTALVVGLLTATSGSASTRDDADSRSFLSATAERIDAANYQKCPLVLSNAYTVARGDVPPPGAGAAGPAAPVVVVQVAVWNGTSFVTPIADNADSVLQPGEAACTYDLQDNRNGSSRMQRITLSHGADVLTFVKRNAESHA